MSESENVLPIAVEVQAPAHGPISPAPFVTDMSSFPEVTEPLMAPSTLESLLVGLRHARNDGIYVACSNYTRDALGFTVRYFAGLFMEASRQLDCLPGQLAESSGSTNVEESARQLLLCLENIQRCPERLARRLTQIFIEEGGGRRAFLDHLTPTEGEFSIVSFCRSPRNDCPRLEDLTRAMRWLDHWMNACFGFFLETEQRFESGAFFGQVEQVVIFEQYTLPTGLTLRLKEMRQPAPDFTSLVLDSDRNEELVQEAANEEQPDTSEEPLDEEAEESEGTMEPIPSAVFSPSKALAISPEDPASLVEAATLVDFLQLKLNQNALRPYTQSKPVQAQGWLDCDIDQVGLRKNSRGKFGYSGYLWIQLRGEGETEIEGTATCENLNVEISGVTFKGIQSRIAYWIDPEELRTPRGHILIRTQNRSKQIPIWKLLPESPLSSFSSSQILALLFGPALAGCFYTSWVFWSTSSRIDAAVHNLLRGEFTRFFNTSSPLSLREAGVGFLDLRLMPQIEASLLLFFCLAWLVPIAASLVYARLPRHEKKDYGLAYGLVLVLPSLYYLMLWPSGLVHGQVFHHPEFRFMDFRQHLTAFSLLNIGTAFIAHLWTGGFFHRHLNALGRAALTILGVSSATLFTLFMVFGRSWLGWA